MRNGIPALCALALAVSVPSFAHEHASGVVKERMDAMTDMAKRDKAISERLKSKRNLAAIKADAETIAEHAPHIPHLFPEGSLQKPTRARSAIWQNWSDFENKAKSLQSAAQKLAGTSPDDAAAMTTAANDMVRVCTSCHEKYRSRR